MKIVQHWVGICLQYISDGFKKNITKSQSEEDKSKSQTVKLRGVAKKKLEFVSENYNIFHLKLTKLFYESPKPYLSLT